MAKLNSTCVDVFLACEQAISNGISTTRKSKRDKEFFFQDWFEARLKAFKLNYDEPSRNKYPDFTLVNTAEGYEIKGLEFPGRVSDFDANSRVPCGSHNGRTIFYVFGRYPKFQDGETKYPLIDLVICHGDFLNADDKYVHKNKNIKGFGTYGDIKIRDRKMYIVPTPFSLLNGASGKRILILPDYYPVDDRLKPVGNLIRKVSDKLLMAYSFDLNNNIISPQYIENPRAGKEYRFIAYAKNDLDDIKIEMNHSTSTSILSSDEDDD